MTSKLSADQLDEQMQKLRRLNEFIIYRIIKMGRLLEADSTSRLKGTGTSVTSYRIMLIISIFEEITVSDLARLLIIDRAQISRVASDMVAKSLITSKRDASNKLKKLLMLTDEGSARLARLRKLFEDRSELISDHATQQELDMLVPLLDRVNEGLTRKLGTI